MGRKNRWETNVEPRLAEIAEWIQILNEEQIAKQLGLSRRTFETYKKEHEELRNALKKGREELVTDLKITLKKKAQGFHYKETKKVIREVDGQKVTTYEEYERYSPPDLGAIHLLLKNYDPTWRNDDQTTIDLKKEKLQLEKDRAENNQWS